MMVMINICQHYDSVANMCFCNVCVWIVTVCDFFQVQNWWNWSNVARLSVLADKLFHLESQPNAKCHCHTDSFIDCDRFFFTLVTWPVSYCEAHSTLLMRRDTVMNLSSELFHKHSWQICLLWRPPVTLMLCYNKHYYHVSHTGWPQNGKFIVVCDLWMMMQKAAHI